MKSLKQKEYLLKLKDEINEFIENFKKRYQLFPWNKVNKLSKFEINSDKPITVNETKFTVKELVKEINKIKGNLQTRMRASYYNFILKAFIKDSIHCTDDEIKNLYHQYQNELKSNFNESKQDLMFCLEALKQINKAFKNDDKEVTESEKVTKTDIFNAVKSYLSKHPDENIKLLSSPKTHTSKNNEEWLLIATLNGDNYKDTCKKLGKEIKVNNENLVFYSCYLPGDVFLFVKMNEVVTESVVFDEKDFKQKEIQSNNENIKESEDNAMRNTFVNNKNEIVDLNDFILECVNDLMEESYDNDVVTEGANLDIRAKFKKMKKEYSASMIEIKKLMKNNKFAEAEEEANKLLVLVKKAKKEVERIDSGVGSVVFGYFFDWTLTFLRTFAACLIPFVGPYVAAILILIDEWKRPIKKIIEGDSLSEDDFNFYKNTAISRMESIEKSVNKLIENIKEAKKDYEDEEKEKAKEDKAVKESAEFRHMKLSLYEACNKGEITVEEREELLKDIQDKFFIKESASEIPQNGLSNKQKFDQVRKVLYERCSRGEISVSERESLIGKAYDMIFVKEAGDPPTPEPANTPDQATKEVDTKEVEKNVESAVKNNSAEINKSLENAVK